MNCFSNGQEVGTTLTLRFGTSRTLRTMSVYNRSTFTTFWTMVINRVTNYFPQAEGVKMSGVALASVQRKQLFELKLFFTAGQSDQIIHGKVQEFISVVNSAFRESGKGFIGGRSGGIITH